LVDGRVSRRDCRGFEKLECAFSGFNLVKENGGGEGMTRSDYLARIQSEKRAGIIAATIDLFVNQPYAGTSMDTIAAAANVSKRTLYNHFPSKEELFIAAIESL
jgi:hypothetical protein